MPSSKETLAIYRKTPKYKAKAAARRKKSYGKNREKILAAAKASRLADPDRFRAYAKSNKNNNPEPYKRAKRTRRQKVTAENNSKIIEYLSNNPCVDCAHSDIRVLEFDHRPGEEKHANISSMIHRNSWETVLKEINKCDVRCANCHRIITLERADNSMKQSYVTMMEGNGAGYLVT